MAFQCFLKIQSEKRQHVNANRIVILALLHPAGMKNGSPSLLLEKQTVILQPEAKLGRDGTRVCVCLFVFLSEALNPGFHTC